MAIKGLNMDVLARMSEDWTDTTSAMLSAVIGLVMQEYHIPEVLVDLGRIGPLLQKFEIDREYLPDMRMRVTMKERDNVLRDV